MSNTDKYDEKFENKDELERLYQIYLRVQSGDKSALDEVFKERNIDDGLLYRADERYKKRRMSNMDNVLDVELILENEKVNEKNRQKDKWLNSTDSRVTFQFSCLNRLLVAMKKDLLYGAKHTGYENGKKKSGHKKFYEGEYDLSDFNSLMNDVIIEIFNTKTDADNCLTLDGKKNEKYPICDGVNLLKNISYFTSRKINKRAAKSHFDIFDMGFYGEESDKVCSYFDKKALEEFWYLERGTSRLSIYAEHLEWLKRNDVHKLFKTNACDINAIIETIMNCDETFIKDMSDDKESGFGMRLVKQEVLQEIIKSRHNMNIEQENISKDLEIIEQRLLDHLLYSLNYMIGKATKSEGIYEKESERFLYKLDNEAYVRMFSRMSYEIYDKSVEFINSDINSNDFESYFRMVKKYEDMVIDIVSLEKGKKKYDMVNLISENDNDLVDDERKTLLDIAKTVIAYYQNQEEEYKRNKLSEYEIRGLTDWEKGYWEAELESDILKINLWSNENVKKPIQHTINKEKLMVYCGYVNFYFCNIEDKVCFRVPKDRRIISRANKNHEIFMYNVG